MYPHQERAVPLHQRGRGRISDLVRQQPPQTGPWLLRADRALACEKSVRSVEKEKTRSVEKEKSRSVEKEKTRGRGASAALRLRKVAADTHGQEGPRCALQLKNLLV